MNRYEAPNATRSMETKGSTAAFQGISTLQLTLHNLAVVGWYEFFTANDVPKRDPVSWTLGVVRDAAACERAEDDCPLDVLSVVKNAAAPMGRGASYGRFPNRMPPTAGVAAAVAAAAVAAGAAAVAVAARPRHAAAAGAAAVGAGAAAAAGAAGAAAGAADDPTSDTYRFVFHLLAETHDDRFNEVSLSEIKLYRADGTEIELVGATNLGGASPDHGREGPSNLVDGEVGTKWLDLQATKPSGEVRSVVDIQMKARRGGELPALHREGRHVVRPGVLGLWARDRRRVHAALGRRVRRPPLARQTGYGIMGAYAPPSPPTSPPPPPPPSASPLPPPWAPGMAPPSRRPRRYAVARVCLHGGARPRRRRRRGRRGQLVGMDGRTLKVAAASNPLGIQMAGEGAIKAVDGDRSSKWFDAAFGPNGGSRRSCSRSRRPPSSAATSSSRRRTCRSATSSRGRSPRSPPTARGRRTTR